MSEYYGHMTRADGSHVPISKEDSEKLWNDAKAAQARRAERMPDELAALAAMFEAYQRLKELGWNDASYCPKDGSTFKVIEAGSTGIFDCHYSGEWPDGHWWTHDGGDLWPSRPMLFKRLPEDQARYEQRMKEAAERFADASHEWFTAPGLKFESCKNCGIVRRADRKNKLCRGPTTVAPRCSVPSPDRSGDA